jgi:NitT/TauT family transport system permease protein
VTTSQIPAPADVRSTETVIPTTDPDSARPSRVAQNIRKAALRTVFLIVELVVAVGLWQAVVSLFDVNPRIVPGPRAVGHSLWSLTRSGFLVDAGWVTLQETLLGFAIGAALGIGLAVLLTEIPVLDTILNPFIVGFQAMPKIALAPLLLIWFGFGISSKVVLVVVMVFFPVLVNTVTGLNSVRPEQLDLMRAYRAGRWATLRRLKFYAALPFLLASFEVSLVLALTAAVVAEILGSGTTVGLGTLLQLYNSRLDMAGMFATVAVLSVLGILLYAVVKVLSGYLLRWNRRSSD